MFVRIGDVASKSTPVDEARRRRREAARGGARHKKLGGGRAAYGLRLRHHREIGEAKQGALAQPPE